MTQEEESFGPIVVGVDEVDLEDADTISAIDAKQILINTFENAYPYFDDVSTYNNGWRIAVASEDDESEEKIDILLATITGGTLELSDLSKAAAEKTGVTYEFGAYTNLSCYFFRQSDAEKHRLEILASIHKIEVLEGEE